MNGRGGGPRGERAAGPRSASCPTSLSCLRSLTSTAPVPTTRRRAAAAPRRSPSRCGEPPEAAGRCWQLQLQPDPSSPLSLHTPRQLLHRGALEHSEDVTVAPRQGYPGPKGSPYLSRRHGDQGQKREPCHSCVQLAWPRPGGSGSWPLEFGRWPQVVRAPRTEWMVRVHRWNLLRGRAACA